MRRRALRRRYGHGRGRVRDIFVKEMGDILWAHGYNPASAAKLADEGMGPYELEHRIRSTSPGAMGSLEYTHGLKKVRG